MCRRRLFAIGRRGVAAVTLSGAAALCAAACAAALAPASARAAFGVSKWEAGTCTNSECTDSGPVEYFYTQAAGHPDFGITDFRMNTEEGNGPLGKVYTPEGRVKDVRVDLPPGLAVNPEAAEECTEAQLLEYKCPAGSQVGVDEATGTVTVSETLLGPLEKALEEENLKIIKAPGAPLPEGVTVTEEFPVYNMERKPGEPARFGVEVKSPAISLLKLETVIYLEGGLSWYSEPPAAGGESSEVATGDYHEYFKIPDIPQQPELVESKLIFWGMPHEHNPAAPNRAFITMPSACNGPQVTSLHVDSYEQAGTFLGYKNPTPVGASGCDALVYSPEISQHPETTRSDAPDGTTVMLHIPQGTEEPAKPNSPDLQTASVTLPEGMTLNPSAANGLEGCTNSQAGLGTDDPVSCPAGSRLGTVVVDAPGIPDGSLTGTVYLGVPENNVPSSGGEYRIFVIAQSDRYGVGLRLEGRVRADPSSGRLVTTFSNLPQVPFENFAMDFKGGDTAPLANPLACGPATTTGSFFPYSNPDGAVAAGSPFTVDLNGSGGPCPSPLPFSLSQASTSSPSTGGSPTAFTFSLSRPEGQQYLSTLRVTLPPGLLGEIPAVSLCGEAQANAGTCPAASAIGSASVAIGSGSKPYNLTGTVFLTGPYDGAPYGLSVAVPAQHVGPFDYGTIVTRAKIEVDPYTAQVEVSSSLPTIVGGAPIRLRSLKVTVDRQGFMINPTSCAAESTDTLLGSTFGATATASSPFQASGCEGLPFAPKFTVATGAKTSRRLGAGLRVKVAEVGGQANIRQVLATLPKKLVVRNSTLKLACLEQTFQTDPLSCPAGSKVGTATVRTPVLPGVLSGPAIFVSQGGRGFPFLDIVLKGDGVSVVLVGETKIKKGFSHSNFRTLPDVPVTSFALNLPRAQNSALAAEGNLCKGHLRMLTTLIGQNGKRVTRKVAIRVGGCAKPARCGRSHAHARGHHRAHRRHQGNRRRHHGNLADRHHGAHGVHAARHGHRGESAHRGHGHGRRHSARRRGHARGCAHKGSGHGRGGGGRHGKRHVHSHRHHAHSRQRHSG